MNIGGEVRAEQSFSEVSTVYSDLETIFVLRVNIRQQIAGTTAPRMLMGSTQTTGASYDSYFGPPESYYVGKYTN